ncbi:MAG: acyltransferase [Saprospiraceae bacterium]|nr:acyltransferase [Saprospiraceae bacterium]
MALAVLVFHFDKWLNGNWDAASPQGRLGIYAVSIFFILSGLTLTLVYAGRLRWSFSSWLAFFQNRFWRIFPLLWLTTAISLIIDDVPRPTWVILLNFSGIFGWIDPSRDIATGAWSIGCELVFYAFFPAILLLSQKWKWLIGLLWGGAVCIALYFAFYLYPSHAEQAIWWPIYVQVFNHASFFLAGIWIGLTVIKPWKGAGIILLILGAGFFLLPISSDPFTLVSGFWRMVFLLMVTVWVAYYFSWRIHWSEGIARILSVLGLISYSLYLWHPIVFRGVQFLLRGAHLTLNPVATFLLALTSSLVWAYFSYRYFEWPLQKRMKSAKI